MTWRVISLGAAALTMSATVCAAQHVAFSAQDSTGRVIRADSLTIAYEVNGVRVIQRPAYSNQIVSVNLYLLGGARQLTPATAGIERLALAAAAEGTRRYPGGRSKAALRRTGSHISEGLDPDWTDFSFVGMDDQFDSTWAVFADRIVAPTLDSAAVATVRERIRVMVSRRREEPDAWIADVADSVILAGHPYGVAPAGTAESMATLTAADVRHYVADQFVTSRMLLVIVGTVTREQVQRAVATTIGTLPRGSYVWTPPPPLPEHRQSTLTVINQPLNTNYLLGLYAGPAITSPDYAAFHVATELLSGNLNNAVREKRSLSYAVYAPFYGNRAIALGGVYASSVAPSLVVPLVREQIQRCQTTNLASWQLRDYVDNFITEYYLSHETNAEQAAALARAAIYRGDYRLADAEFEAFRNVSVGEVQQAASRYMRHIQFVYLGDPSGFDPKLVKGF
jgi:zinc protease